MDDPVCVVGMACRLPGGITSPSGLWDFLMNKKSAQGPVPEGRFRVQGFCDSSGRRAGVVNATGGYFLDEDVRNFDNAFFGINHLEATSMDPQQRKLLEVVYECFEHAGVTLDHVSGSSTGVFVGSFTTDYQMMQSRDPDFIHRYTATGCGTTILSNRISHVFNLQGPSLTIDTACSSSIYCLHNAVTAIQAGDCDAAIVAAGNLIMSPEQWLGTSKAGVISPTSTCHTFDASADGYGRGEAVNAVYVKRLSAALRDGDKVWAIVRGTAVNANGKTPGITQPSTDLQETVIRKAYSRAGLDMAETDYVECHGTGTPVGDPIEIEAISRCFPRQGKKPLLIGSSKTSLGHSEAASGLTAMIKVILAFENGKLPPTQGVNKLNPKLRLGERNIQVVTNPESWPGPIRRASVNSYGYGGANSSLILECPKSYHSARTAANRNGNAHTNGVHLSGEKNGTNGDSPIATEDHLETEANDKLNTLATEEDLIVLPISAASTRSLKARIEDISTILKCADAKTLWSFADTLGRRSTHFAFRYALLWRPADGIEGVQLDGLARSPAPSPIAFVFTGQGAQYAQMAKALIVRSQSFKDTFRKLDDILRSLPIDQAPDWTLEQTLLETEEVSRIHDVARSQPICTALQIAIVDMLGDSGIHPSGGVIGHSSGEIAAAYAAGLLTARQAILVAYYRGQAAAKLENNGAMLAAGLSVQDAQSIILEHGLSSQVCVACVNSPQSVTLSGSIAGIDKLQEEIQGVRNKFARKLQTGGRAYHSHQMKEIGRVYEDLISPLFGQSGATAQVVCGVSGANKVKMCSSVGQHGDEPIKVDENTHWPSYWRNNLEMPVQFQVALEKLTASHERLHLVEIGPHSALKGPIQQIRKYVNLDEQALRYSNSLTRGEDADLCIKRLYSTLWVHGHSPRWQNVNFGASYLQNTRPPQFKQLLPRYSWDYSGGILWQEPRMSTDIRNRAHTRHELLGSLNVAGDGVNWSWRNVLRLDEVPWLRDHRIESQVVFPAAAYLAVVIEAMRQLHPELDSDAFSASFHFRNVGINAALVIPDDQQSEKGQVELHTRIAAKQLSTTTSSSDWYDFTLSSVVASATPTVHCSGSVQVQGTLVETHANDDLKAALSAQNPEDMEFSPILDRWYAKFEEGGLAFGPTFRSIQGLWADTARQRREVICSTPLNPLPDETSYPVHPITIDACLQAGIMSNTAGDLRALRGFMPVFIKECLIQPYPRSLHDGPKDDGLAKIYARSNKTGVASERIDCMLTESTGKVVVDLHQVRMSKYTAKLGSEPDTTRQPCLRVQWKPDIHLVNGDDHGSESLTKYLATSIQRLREDDVELAGPGKESIMSIGILFDLFGHKNPRMNVLDLDDRDPSVPSSYMSFLGAATGFQRYRSWTRATWTEHGVSVPDAGGVDLPEGFFQVVLLLQTPSPAISFESFSQDILPLVATEGAIIAFRTEETLTALHQAQLKVYELPGQIVLAIRPRETIQGGETRKDTSTLTLRDRAITIVIPPSSKPNHTSRYADALSEFLRDQTHAKAVNVVSLGENSHSMDTTDKDCIYVSLLEMEKEFLATMSQNDMDLLRKITDKAPILLWITGAGMLGKDPNPTLTLSSGLSRALMLEQPTLQFAVLDVGFVSDQEALRTSQNILTTIELLLADDDQTQTKKDKEFIQADGLLHISRFSPDLDLNKLFRRRVAMEHQGQLTYAVQDEVISSARPVQLAIGSVGLSDTIHFQQICEPTTSVPPAGFIDVLLRGVSLNAKDVYALNGRVETPDAKLALEFSGVVTATGPGVETADLKPGDRVVVLAPCRYTTTERVPAWAAHKILPTEEFTVMPTLPVIYCTVLFALRNRGHLRAGESVLIHSGSGAFGLAAIAVAKRMGATVYTTTGSAEKRAFVAAKTGIPASHIFHSRDASFAAALKQVTGGRGVDLVVNSLVGDLMHASWSCVAPFGRFVEIGKRELVDAGKRELVDAGKLDMDVFLRNATFTAFDLSDLYFGDQYQRDILRSMMAEVLQMYRSVEIEPVPIRTFPVFDLVQAYRYFSSKDRIGKVAISLEDDQVKIPVAPAKYRTVLDPEKVYLLIGCLGGLGRSLTRWMMMRGARNFVLLGRSGCDKPTARALVDSLMRAGASVTVIRGDVSSASSVADAVSACIATGKPIGGIIQAAMGLQECLFSSMPSEAWHKAIQPKYAGTLNLHEALKGHEEALDFFALTSSVSGTLGTATESNYCAANGFLDAFARWRRSQGKPAVAVGLGMISEVGYLHENPEIEALLLRRGIQPLNEAEFLQVMDMALAGDMRQELGSSHSREALWSSHILTGLETSSIRQLMDRGFDVGSQALEDPRAAILSAALEADIDKLKGGILGDVDSGRAASDNAAAWFKALPPNFKAGKVLAQEAQAPSLQMAVLELIRKRFSNLILMPLEQIADDKPLAGFGVDSMIASEFRSWFWTTFTVDVPFLDLLSPNKTLAGLAAFASSTITSEIGGKGQE